MTGIVENLTKKYKHLKKIIDSYNNYFFGLPIPIGFLRRTAEFF